MRQGSPQQDVNPGFQSHRGIIITTTIIIIIIIIVVVIISLS